MRLGHRPAALIAVAVAAALTLAGCGSDDDTSAGGGGDTAATADSGSADTGSADTGAADGGASGSEDTGAGESGSADTGSADSGSADTGSADTGAADSATGGAQDVPKPEKVVVALVPSSNADTIMGSAEPMTKYLSEQLGVPVEATVTKDYTAAVEAIGSDQAQIAFLPVLPMAQAVDRYDAQAALQVVRDGKTTYHTQFFTDDPDKYCSDEPAPAGDDGFLYCNGTGEVEDGPAGLDALPKMEGAKMAYVEQTSASGFIFPALDMMNAGMDATSDVEPIFAGSHDGAVLAVYNGDAEVGVSFDDARTIVEDKPDVGEKVVVFALSEEIPNDGVVTSKGLDPAFSDMISQALIDFSGTDQGKKTLDDLYQITEFDKADPASLEIVKEAAEKLGLN